MKSLGPAFQFYVDDFVGGTLGMSAADIGAYLLMLCHQWNAGCVPSKSRELGQITRRKPSQLGPVLAKFSKDENGNYVNKRMAQLRAERITYLNNQAAAGKASADKRRSTAVEPPLQPPLQPEGQPEGKSPSPSPSPSEEEDKSGAAKRARFTPPTVEEVRACVASLGAHIDAQKFVDFYEASGWMRGKTAIKSWKACVRTWRRDDAAEKPKPAAPGRWVDPHADVIPGLTDYRGGKA